MNDPIGEVAVVPCVLVNRCIKVLAVIHEVDAETMMEIEHTGDAIKTISVKMIFIQPITAVG